MPTPATAPAPSPAITAVAPSSTSSSPSSSPSPSSGAPPHLSTVAGPSESIASTGMPMCKPFRFKEYLTGLAFPAASHGKPEGAPSSAATATFTAGAAGSAKTSFVRQLVSLLHPTAASGATAPPATRVPCASAAPAPSTLESTPPTRSAALSASAASTHSHEHHHDFLDHDHFGHRGHGHVHGGRGRGGRGGRVHHGHFHTGPSPSPAFPLFSPSPAPMDFAASTMSFNERATHRFDRAQSSPSAHQHREDNRSPETVPDDLIEFRNYRFRKSTAAALPANGPSTLSSSPQRSVQQPQTHLPLILDLVTPGSTSSQKHSYDSSSSSTPPVPKASPPAYLSIPMSQWTVADVMLWLASMDLSEYKEFSARKIDGDLLSELSEEDFIELGVRDKFHRRKMLKRRNQILDDSLRRAVAEAATPRGAGSSSMTLPPTVLTLSPSGSSPCPSESPSSSIPSSPSGLGVASGGLEYPMVSHLDSPHVAITCSVGHTGAAPPHSTMGDKIVSGSDYDVAIPDDTEELESVMEAGQFNASQAFQRQYPSPLAADVFSTSSLTHSPAPGAHGRGVAPASSLLTRAESSPQPRSHLTIIPHAHFPSPSSPSLHSGSLRIISMEELHDLVRLNEGIGGIAYKATYRGGLVVVKTPKAERVSNQEWLELQLHMALPDHPHLVEFIGICMLQTQMFFVTKFISKGSLKGLLMDPTPTLTRFYFSDARTVAKCGHQISQALLHLHRHHILHRDVAARNILVDEHFQFVLADLGLGRWMDSTRDNKEQKHGHHGHGHGPHSDTHHASGCDVETKVYPSHSLSLAKDASAITPQCKQPLAHSASAEEFRPMGSSGLSSSVSTATLAAPAPAASFAAGGIYSMVNGSALPCRWVCPWSLGNGVFTAQSDVYSLGVCLVEMLSQGGVPFAHVRDNYTVMSLVSSGKLCLIDYVNAQFASAVPPALMDVLHAMLEPDPSKRCTMQKVSSWLLKAKEQLERELGVLTPPIDSTTSDLQ